MKTFEYATVLLSILLGACIAQLMANFVQIIQTFGIAKLYVPHILWNVIGCIVILAHWVHVYQAERREEWNALQILILFLTPMVYYVTAQILGQPPIIEGKPDFPLLFETKRHLIYLTAAIFTVLTMAHHYTIYESHNKLLYGYYSFATLQFVAGIFLSFPLLDYVISIAVVLSELVHHFYLVPLQLRRTDERNAQILAEKHNPKKLHFRM